MAVSARTSRVRSGLTLTARESLCSPARRQESASRSEKRRADGFGDGVGLAGRALGDADGARRG